MTIMPPAMRRTLATLTMVWLCGGVLSRPVHAQTQDAFFSDDDVQDVSLTMSERDWQTLKENYEQDTYYSADLRWRGVVVRNVGVRSRGNTTRNGVKPGLRIDINRYISEQEFVGLKGFALDNAYSDRSLMRERLVMKMFARLALPAPREAHVRLFVNDRFAGVYVLIESIDRAFISRRFGAFEGDVERGGFLFDYRWVRPYHFEALGSGLEAYAELFTPKTRETESMSTLFGPLRDLITAINDSPDDRFAAEVGALLDLRQVVRVLAVENFMSEVDGFLGEWGVHNIYLYRFRDLRPAVLLPWDKDTSFWTVDHPVTYHIEANVLARRALMVPDLAQLYVDTLVECAAVASEPAADGRGWLEHEIDRVYRQIEAGVAADPGLPVTADDVAREVEALRSFARARPARVLREITASDSQRRR